MRSGANKFCFLRPLEPSFRVFLDPFSKGRETLGPLWVASSYISLVVSFFARDMNKPTANIACDINEGKRKNQKKQLRLL